MQHHRWVEKGSSGGVVAAIIAYNYPNQLALAQARAPRWQRGCTVILKSAPDTPLITLAPRRAGSRNHTDIPAGPSVNVAERCRSRCRLPC